MHTTNNAFEYLFWFDFVLSAAAFVAVSCNLNHATFEFVRLQHQIYYIIAPRYINVLQNIINLSESHF